MQVIKVIFIVVFLLASMVGVILGAGYIAANNPMDSSHKHDLVLVEATDPTCTENGFRKHYACKECGELYADASGFAKLDFEAIAIAPYGHDAGAASCTDSVKCNTCNQVISEAKGHTPVTDAAIEPTCTANGKTEGSHCSVCGEVIKAQITVSSKGHTYDSSTDFECNNCDYVRDASECPHLADTLTKQVVPPTCTEIGYTVYVCVCDYYFTADEVPATGHTEVTDAGVAPGCLDKGLSEGKHCSVCNEVTVEQKPVDAKGVHNWNGLTCTDCHATRFEAESADIVYQMPEGETKVVSTGREGKTPAETNYPSGDSFVYFMSYSDTTTLTFYVTASEAGKATVSVRMGCATYSAMLDNLFYVEVNGVKYENRPGVEFPAWSKVKYYDWLELEISDIELKEGENIIKVIKPIPPEDAENRYSSKFGLNFDYVAICPENSSMTLQDTRDANGHVKSEVDISTYPTYEAGGKLRVYCENCRLYEDIDLPKISLENYTKISGDTFTSVWQYTHGDQKFEFTVEEVVTKYTFTANTDSDPFATKNGGSVKDPDGADVALVTEPDANGKYYYANAKDNTRHYTMTVYVAEDTTVKVYFGLAKNNATLAPKNIIKNLKVGGSADGVTYSTTSISWTNKTGNWFVFGEHYIAVLELKAGVNVITFDIINTSLNMNSVAFESKTAVTLGKAE